MNRKKRPPLEISLLLDGRLPPDQESEWRDRIDADPALRSGFASFNSTTELLRAGDTIEELPTGFDARLRARLRTEELTSRARMQARGSEGESWWQRVAMGLGGLAAGVAVMLAIGPIGRDLEPQEYAVGGSSVTDVVLPGSVPESVRLSPSEIQSLASKRARGLEQLGRTVRSAGTTVSPELIRVEMQLSGLGGQSRGLLANAIAHKDSVGKQTVQFLESVESVCTALEQLVQQAEASNRGVSSSEAARLVGIVLAQASAIPAVEAGPEFGAAHQFSRVDKSIPGNESEAYAGVHQAFQAEEYWMAVGLSRQFLETWPSSQWSGAVCRFAAVSLQRLGDSAGALRLVDSVSQRRAVVLHAFSRAEIDAMLSAVVGEPKQSNQITNNSQMVTPALFNMMANQLNSLLTESGAAESAYRNVAGRMATLDELEQTQANILQFRNSATMNGEGQIIVLQDGTIDHSANSASELLEFHLQQQREQAAAREAIRQQGSQQRPATGEPHRQAPGRRWGWPVAE